MGRCGYFATQDNDRQLSGTVRGALSLFRSQGYIFTLPTERIGIGSGNAMWCVLYFILPLLGQDPAGLLSQMAQ
ncbi:uncharacterized protein LY89DRAFT_686650 [Mollisia scopiformis]|uniref:Uncharacterized protein n=1 Tax=Mollisia scopiformis TaxID=149040 RepID=A0A194X4V2_MOLSC|nr:uncharacterized protein LY89DRAFT_686650 [Mollisia scopiformis]KUJ15099.1 hypothetical protein LY89DRAFT_686650 [Mollisia scopiformis]